MAESFTSICSGLSNVLVTEVQLAVHPSNTNSFSKKWKAIWDTGATSCVVTQKVVDTLGLVPATYVNVSGVGGIQERPCYYIDLKLPNNVVVQKILAPLGDISGCDILIGMNVIGTGDFAVSNFNGRTAFTFRQPSLMTFDFTSKSYLEPVRITDGKPGRNSPCPCGSGKKYKHCCGK